MKWFLALCLLAAIGGWSYGAYNGHQLRKTLHSKDSLLLVADTLHRQSDSLTAIAHRADTVWRDSVVPHLITKWDTVRIDSMIYVPIAQADSVKDQRDLCIVNYDVCMLAREKAVQSRDAEFVVNGKLRELIARDSLKRKGPHLDMVLTAGVGAIKPFGDNKVVTGIGLIVGARLWGFRVF